SGDRADNADGVEISQSGHVFDEQHQQHRHDRGQSHAKAGNTPAVKPLKYSRNLTVTRHEELDCDKVDNRSVDGGKKKRAEYDADDEAECVTEHAADENLSHIAQHVIAHALRAQGVDVAVDNC